jgi:hypothetical protein
MGTTGEPRTPFNASTIWDFRTYENTGKVYSYLAVRDRDNEVPLEEILDDAYLFWEKLYRELGFVEIRFIEAD